MFTISSTSVKNLSKETPFLYPKFNYLINIFFQTHYYNDALDSVKPIIDGATALKLDEALEEKNNIQTSISATPENVINDEVAPGVSIENASYIENNSDLNIKEENNKVNTEEEDTPQLFSSETETTNNESEIKESENENISQDEQLFNQDINNNDEDDFEIPAFLRRQKF